MSAEGLQHVCEVPGASNFDSKAIDPEIVSRNFGRDGQRQIMPRLSMCRAAPSEEGFQRLSSALDVLALRIAAASQSFVHQQRIVDDNLHLRVRLKVTDHRGELFWKPNVVL